MKIEARHYCRKCRAKLPEPVENKHHAFCTEGCFEQFYHKRCLRCEKPLRTARRSFCPKPASEMPILRASNSASEATFLPPNVFVSGGGAIRSRATSPSTTRMG
jgi:hypothetical protein